MHDSNANAYLRTKVMSASPAELRLMLLDGAIKFATQAREGLASRDFETAFNGFTQCRATILELVNGIRPEHDPELSERVRGLYLFMYKELFEASFEKDVARVDKVIDLLGYERETWVLLMEQIAREASARPTAPIAVDGPRSLSVQA